jgi:hypothetical protein
MSQLGILVTSACNIFKSCFFKDMMETLKVSEGSMQNPRIALVWEHISETKKKKKDKPNVTM